MGRYRSPQTKQIIAGIVVMGGMVIFQGRDQLYFDNGNGGNDWKIGQSKTHLLNAHQSRSLSELQTQALTLVNRDRQLNRAC